MYHVDKLGHLYWVKSNKGINNTSPFFYITWTDRRVKLLSWWCPSPFVGGGYKTSRDSSQDISSASDGRKEKIAPTARLPWYLEWFVIRCDHNINIAIAVRAPATDNYWILEHHSGEYKRPLQRPTSRSISKTTSWWDDAIRFPWTMIPPYATSWVPTSFRGATRRRRE